MKILVTGANGFIGSNLVENLVRSGNEVTAFCEYNSFSSRGWLDSSSLKGDFKSILGDIRDIEFVEKSVEGVDCVMHLASLIAIPYSYSAPRSYLETNVIGTLNVLEAVRKYGSRLIHTSTSEVYGTPKGVPITEEFPLTPQSPYAASKASADLLVQSYTKSFNLNSLILRPFNTYGPRQSARAVIPTIMTQAIGSNLIVLGSKFPRRDLTFVSDTVAAYEMAVLQDHVFDGQVIQLGFGETISIEQLVGLIGEVIDKQLEIRSEDERTRPSESEVVVLLSDRTKALECIGWRPQVSLKTGLQKTWQWFQEHSDLYFNHSEYAI